MAEISMDSIPSNNAGELAVALEKNQTDMQEPTGNRDIKTIASVDCSDGTNVTNIDDGQNIPKKRITYTKDELFKLKNSPASLEWPKGIDISIQKVPGKSIDLDKLVKLIQDNRKGGTAASEISSNDKPEGELKKTKDPRERIRQEEQDGIILSPQRRSFGTGCRVQNQMLAFANSRRPDSPADAVVPTRESHRELPARRIGSGRIMRRDEIENHYEREPREDPRRMPRDWRSKQDMKNDKRRRYYDEDRRQHDRSDQRDRRYDNHRHHMAEEEAPEWFTGGPSSQKDCIELVGFEESEGMKDNWMGEKDNSKEISHQDPPVNQKQPKTQEFHNQDPPQDHHSNPVVIEPSDENDAMNYDVDSIISFLNIGSEDSPAEGTSRLKQFFHDHDTSNDTNPMQDNIQTQLNSLINSSSEVPSTRSSQESRFFAPIAPASNSNRINDLGLNKDLHNVDGPSVQDLLCGGRGQTLQDLEADMKRQDMKVNGPQRTAFTEFLSRVNQTPHDQEQESILRKLMNGAGKDSAFPSRPAPFKQPALPNALTERELLALMKNGDKNMQVRPNQMRPVGTRKPLGNQPVSVMHNPDVSNFLAPPNHDVLMKLQQKKAPQLLHPGFQGDPIKQLMGMPSPPYMQQNDVQNLIHCLAVGTVTAAQLKAQLSNPSLHAHQKENINTVLKILHNHPNMIMALRSTMSPSPTAGTLPLGSSPMNLSPRVASPNPDPTLHAPMMMPQRVSPLMFNGTVPGNPRRPPSHQELIAHTQSIHMKALLKEKLERNKEKHRKQETDRIKSPNPGMGPTHSLHNMHDVSPIKNQMKSQSPLAFTPTSVIRKMTADRERIDKVNPPGDPGRHGKHISQGQNQSLNALHGLHGVTPNTRMVQNHTGLMGPNMTQHWHNRTHVPNVLQLNHNDNNNMGYDHGLQVPPMVNGPSHRGSPINLANIFGRDIVAQAQSSNLPDMPSQVLSLEEVERLQQNQASMVDYQYKYVR